MPPITAAGGFDSPAQTEKQHEHNHKLDLWGRSFLHRQRSDRRREENRNSASTSGMMVNLYQFLEANRRQSKGNRAQAFRNAALKSMKDPRYRHPSYWAGFVIIGNGSETDRVRQVGAHKARMPDLQTREMGSHSGGSTYETTQRVSSLSQPRDFNRISSPKNRSLLPSGKR